MLGIGVQPEVLYVDHLFGLHTCKLSSFLLQLSVKNSGELSHFPGGPCEYTDLATATALPGGAAGEADALRLVPAGQVRIGGGLYTVHPALIDHRREAIWSGFGLRSV